MSGHLCSAVHGVGSKDFRLPRAGEGAQGKCDTDTALQSLKSKEISEGNEGARIASVKSLGFAPLSSLV